MKKLGISLLILFFILASIYAVFQSNFARNMVRDLLTKNLEASGYRVDIGQIEGTLPHQIDLKNVTIEGNGAHLTLQELSLRPVLWRLFKKEIAFNDIHAKNISISNGAPFDFDGKFRLSAKTAYLKGKIADWNLQARFDRKLYLAQFRAQNPLLNLKGIASLNNAYELTTAKVQLSSDQIFKTLPFEASGRFLGNLIVDHENNRYQGRLSWQVPNLVVEETKIGSVKGVGDFTWANRVFKGEFSILPFAKASLDLEVTPNWQFAGPVNIEIENLQTLHIPNVYGKLAAKANFRIFNEEQEVEFDATATDFYYGTLFAQKASLYSDLKDPFHQIAGPIDLEFEKMKWNSMNLEILNLETTLGQESAPFKLFAEGKWKHPLEVRMNGTWKDHFSADIESLNGTFFNHPYQLTHPVHFEYSPEIFRLQDVELTIANATALLHIDRQGKRTDARIRLVQLPIDFLSLNPLDFPISGTLDLEADLHEENEKMKGDLNASIANLQPFDATGSFTGSINRDQLALQGNLRVHQKPLINLDLSVPIHLSLWPFEADIHMHRSAHGHLVLDGRIEEFLDFLNLGPHRIEGDCICDLNFTNTLYRPLLNGSIAFTNGTYDNYYTGTALQNIQAEFLAEKNTLFLRSFKAQDNATGTLSANGEIALRQGDLYPFRIDAAFENLKFAEIDLVNATADGKIRIEGNTSAATAKGDVHILNCAFNIPDHIPNPVPNLQVTYINPIHPTPPPQTNYHPYPLYLDLHVLAPEAITITGRGLESEWKGDFHLGGTYTELAAKGKLELIDGEFNFSSRSFKLTEGSLSLSGKEHEMPYLNIAGSMETKGVTITARLKGPLNNPQVTLQSLPALPLGSIMSLLLFGQDLSEISGFQALQIATSLASLAGTGPDVMESTRRSLGVDRLRVITDPTEEGGETVALQVGKYISKGVLVTFTQGTEESSTNISVEVEIKGNIVFQIQSDQHQEQGVFTVKWNLNY